MTCNGFWTPIIKAAFSQESSAALGRSCHHRWPPTRPHSTETVHPLPTLRLRLPRNCCPSIPRRPLCSPRPPVKPVGGDRPQEVMLGPAVSASAPSSLQKQAQPSRRSQALDSSSHWSHAISRALLTASPTQLPASTSSHLLRPPDILEGERSGEQTWISFSFCYLQAA